MVTIKDESNQGSKKLLKTVKDRKETKMFLVCLIARSKKIPMFICLRTILLCSLACMAFLPCISNLMLTHCSAVNDFTSSRHSLLAMYSCATRKVKLPAVSIFLTTSSRPSFSTIITSASVLLRRAQRFSRSKMVAKAVRPNTGFLAKASQ